VRLQSPRASLWHLPTVARVLQVALNADHRRGDAGDDDGLLDDLPDVTSGARHPECTGPSKSRWYLISSPGLTHPPHLSHRPRYRASNGAVRVEDDLPGWITPSVPLNSLQAVASSCSSVIARRRVLLRTISPRPNRRTSGALGDLLGG
jgi:hypothetical protein